MAGCLYGFGSFQAGFVKGLSRKMAGTNMIAIAPAQERDFLNQLDCPHCHTGASVGIDKAWESSLEPRTLNVKWICKAKVNGMSCDFRKWERIPIPEVIDNKRF